MHPTFLAHHLSLLCWCTGKIIKNSILVMYTVLIVTMIIGFTLAPMFLYGEFLTRVPNKGIFFFLICQANPIII